MAQTVKNAPAMEETRVQLLGQEDPLEKEMATHASTVAWKIPWTEEPGGLQSMGSHSRIRLSDLSMSMFSPKAFQMQAEQRVLSPGFFFS